MSRNSTSPKPTEIKHSDPIPIHQRSRARSVSSASSGSASSTYDPPTPVSGSVGSNSIRTSIPSPTSSPIFSYFMSSPTKTTATFPLRRKFPGTTPVFEEEEDTERELPAAVHMRRTSNQMANRFTEPRSNTLPEPHLERGTGLLRRLSLSSNTFAKPYDPSNARSPPSPPPNTAVSKTPSNTPFVNKPRRSATISTDSGRPRRAPSPMGERILKGHFDGF